MDYFFNNFTSYNCRAAISVILELQTVLVKPFIVHKSSSICFMSLGERLRGPIVVVQFLFRPLCVCVCSGFTELCKHVLLEQGIQIFSFHICASQCTRKRNNEICAIFQ